MKRIISLLLIITTLAVMLVSCSKDKSDGNIPEGMQICAEGDGYTFYVPKEWTVQPSVSGIDCAYVSSADKSCVTLAKTTLPDGKSIEEYWEENVDGLKKYDSFEITLAAERTDFGNSNSVRYEYRFKDGETEYGAVQCFCLDGNRLYILTYLAPMTKKYTGATYYEENLEAAFSAIENFTLDGKKAEDTLTSFEDEKTPDGMMLVSDTRIVKYKLYVPKNYVIDIQSGYTGVHPEGSTSSVSVFYSVPKANTIDAYAEELKEKYSELYDNFEQVGEPRIVDVAKTKGVLYEFCGSYNGKNVKFSQLFIINGSYVYTLTYTATEEEYGNYYDDFVKVIDSFDFK